MRCFAITAGACEMSGAGDFDRSIIIERPVATRDGFNNEVVIWHPLAKRRASWRRASAREQLASQETGAAIEDIFEIRWSTMAASITPKDRLRFQERIYNIVEATEVGRRERIRLKATARSD